MKPFKTMHKGVQFDSNNFHRPEGAGNFDNMDDYNIVQSINTRQGTIQHTPTNNKDIVNKEYVDNAIPATPTLQEVTDAGATTNDSITLTSPAVLKGDRMILMFSHAAGVTGAGSTTLYMKAGEVLCSGVKSPVMPRAGSIISLTAMYDIANAMGGPTPSITFESRINNTAALVSALSAQSNGTDKETRVTQARGTAGSTFVAGDNLAADFITTAIKGATMDITNIIMLIEVVFDD